MKKLLLPVLILICCYPSIAQWSVLPSGSTRDLYSVQFTSRDTGYVVGNKAILKTVNAGASWTSLTNDTSKFLYSIYFTAADTAYTVGVWTHSENSRYSNLFKSTNSCASWDSLPYAMYEYQKNGVFQSIFFPNSSIGYAVGDANNIIKTIDGGAQWSFLQCPATPSNLLDAVFFLNADTGYAVGWNNHTMGVGGTMIKTVNGGSTWDTLNIGTTNGLTSVYFTDSDTGYAAGVAGTIIKTTNGGATWTTLSSGTSSWLTSIYFTHPDTGYAAGTGGTIIKTTDGGLSWLTLSTKTTNDIYSFYFTNSQTCYAVGANGIILKTNSGGINTGIFQSPQIALSDFAVYPNPVKSNLFFSNLHQNATISIYDYQGKLLIHKPISENQMYVGDLKEGIYIYKVIGKNIVTSGKFIKE